MREAIVIRAGRLVRPEGVSDEDWARSLGRHRRSRRWVRAHKLADETYDLMHALLSDVDGIGDRRVNAVRAVAMAALQAAEASRFAGSPEMQDPIMRLRRRLAQYVK
tara:strand:+ start:15961 stop:16281 length:321 start_codon:yes stop_codon:yes gene_type:complete